MSKNRNHLYIEKQGEKQFTATFGGANQPSINAPTQGQTIAMSKQVFPDAPRHVERVRDTKDGNRPKWR